MKVNRFNMKIDINVIKKRLLYYYPLFGSIIANIDIKENYECETCKTNGKSILYNPNFMSSLSLEKQTFLFAHELCHIAFEHIKRSKGKNHHYWNIATDAVINALLKKDGLDFVEGGVDIEEAVNEDAETMYKKLLKEKDEKYNNMNEFSSHNLWKDNRSMSDKIKELLENLFTKEKNQNRLKQAVLKLNEENKNESEIKLNNSKLKLKKLKDLKKELNKSLSKMTSQQNQNSKRNDKPEFIELSVPLLDWRKVLKESINQNVDWSYQNATIEENILTSHLEEYSSSETEVILDTSSSIETILLVNFLKELKNILKNSKIKVGCFDDKFYGFTEIRRDEDIDNMDFPGGGGTNFNAAIKAFSRRVENKIIFTDGYASMPELSIDAIWIVFGDTKIYPKGGRVIYIDKEHLNNLKYDNKNKIKILNII